MSKLLDGEGFELFEDDDLFGLEAEGIEISKVICVDCSRRPRPASCSRRLEPMLTVHPAGLPAQTLDSTVERCDCGSAPAGSATASDDFFSMTTSASLLAPVDEMRAAATSLALLPSVAAAVRATPTSALKDSGGKGGAEGGDGGGAGGSEGGNGGDGGGGAGG